MGRSPPRPSRSTSMVVLTRDSRRATALPGAGLLHEAQRAADQHHAAHDEHGREILFTGGGQQVVGNEGNGREQQQNHAEGIEKGPEQSQGQRFPAAADQTVFTVAPAQGPGFARCSAPAWTSCRRATGASGCCRAASSRFCEAARFGAAGVWGRPTPRAARSARDSGRDDGRGGRNRAFRVVKKENMGTSWDRRGTRRSQEAFSGGERARGQARRDYACRVQVRESRDCRMT